MNIIFFKHHFCICWKVDSPFYSLQKEMLRLNNWLRSLLTCSVCLNVFDDPHQLPCGHSFCQRCLEYQTELVVNQLYHCPECRSADVLPTPAWFKTFALNDIVDYFKYVLKVCFSPTSIHNTYCQELQPTYLNILSQVIFRPVTVLL